MSTDNKKLKSDKELVRVLDNGNIQIDVGSAAEAKLAIKQLRLHKKQLRLDKKAIAARIAQIRSEYRTESASRGSMFRGGGGLGKFIRGVQRANRDGARSSKENAIAPLEREKMNIDRLLADIDAAIIKIEKYILDNS